MPTPAFGPPLVAVPKTETPVTTPTIPPAQSYPPRFGSRLITPPMGNVRDQESNSPTPPQSPSSQANPRRMSSPYTITQQAEFAGLGTDACAMGAGMPLNTAADVNATQDAEFTNFQFGVYGSTGGFVPVSNGSNPESQYSFWCGTNGVNGSQLPECSAGESSISFSDADIVYDRYIARWLANAVVLNSVGNPVGPANGAPPKGTLAVQVNLTGTGGNQIVSFTGTPTLNPESTFGLYDGPFFTGQMSFGAYTSTSNCVPTNQLCGMINMALGMPGY